MVQTELTTSVVLSDSEVTKMSSDQTVVQGSRYWKSWRAQNFCSLQVKVFHAKIEVDASSTVRVSQIDPYVVVFLTKDRSQSKKKTSIQKKTLTPMWNEFVFFSNVVRWGCHRKVNWQVRFR